MKQKPYYMSCVIDGNHKWVEAINAKPITVPGFENVELFIHRDGLYDDKKQWRISEAKSGCMLWSDHGKQSDVISQFIDLWNKYASNKVVNIQMTVDEQISKYGISPRYQE